jgi:DNA repair protein RadC
MTTDLTFQIRSQRELLSAVLEIDVDVADQLLKEAGTVFNIPKRMDIPKRYGIPEQSIMKLGAALALANKGRLSTDLRKRMTQGEKIAANFAELGTLAHEELWVAYLNDQGKMLRKEAISRGDDQQTGAGLNLIVRNAVHCNAYHVLLAHNHPDGDHVGFSEPDVHTTLELAKRLAVLGIGLLDHVIVHNGSYMSMREEKILGDKKDAMQMLQEALGG